MRRKQIMRATLALAGIVIFFSAPASCQQKVATPVAVCVQSSQLKFTPRVMPQAFINVAYSASLVDMASGGTAPYTWAVTSGTLPAGMALSSSGMLSGTPTVAGNFGFTVTVTDSSVACAPSTVIVGPAGADKRPRHQSVTVAVRTAI